MNHTEKKAQAINNTVNLIREYIKQPEIIAMKEKNVEEFKNHMKSLFSEFAGVQPALFEITIMGEDTSMLDIILKGLIKNSKGLITKDEMEKEIGIGVMEAIEYSNMK